MSAKERTDKKLEGYPWTARQKRRAKSNRKTRKQKPIVKRVSRGR